MSPTQAVKGFGRFWYDFVVGDDWVMAAGVIIALALTWLAAPAPAAWVIMPLAVSALLALSLVRASRSMRPNGPGIVALAEQETPPAR